MPTLLKTTTHKVRIILSRLNNTISRIYIIIARDGKQRWPIKCREKARYDLTAVNYFGGKATAVINYLLKRCPSVCRYCSFVLNMSPEVRHYIRRLLSPFYFYYLYFFLPYSLISVAMQILWKVS